jgi:murein DD-endopeptidase MepM/ murein hydrolase activator NlpD
MPVKESQSPAPSLAPDPLRFTFPTTAVEPVSLWRPPLYPVPWEPTPYDHFYFIRPIGANEVNWPLARYRYGGFFYGAPHTGIDIPAPKGTPIMAAGPGEVMWSGYGLYFLRNEYQDPYGIAVAIKHDFGYQGKMLYTIYGHMEESYVWRGQRLQAGDIIGRVGETGKASGPHLHFEVRMGDNVLFGTRNPELWISPPQGYGILVGRVMRGRSEYIPEQKVILVSDSTSRIYDVMTYAKGAVNADSYYKENVVLGDLPAGVYHLYIDLETITVKTILEIKSGLVTYFAYEGKRGFSFEPPSAPGQAFIPPDSTPTINP